MSARERTAADARLLSRANREEAIDIGCLLATAGNGGQLFFGAEDSGRREMAEAAHAAFVEASGLDRRISIDLPATPRDELGFLRMLARRLSEALAAAPEACEQFAAINNETDNLYAREGLRDGIRLVPHKLRPALLIFDIDCIARNGSHESLDELFAALRDVFVDNGVVCFATAYRDAPRFSSGVSHFTNNFGVTAPRPVTPEEVVEDLLRRRPDEPTAARVVEAIVREWGFAELSARRGLDYAEALLRRGSSAEDLAAQLRERARNSLRSRASRYWASLDERSRRTLRRATSGLDSARVDDVNLLFSHAWSPYLLTRSSDRVIVSDAGLREFVREEALREAAANTAAEAERILRHLVTVLQEGDPTEVRVLATHLEQEGALPSVRARASRLRAAAEILEHILRRSYRDAAQRLSTVGRRSTIITETAARWFGVQALLEARDRHQWSRRPPRDLIVLFATEFARAERRARLGYPADAFSDYCKLFDAAIVELLCRAGIADGRASLPSDGLDFYRRDVAVRFRTGDSESPPDAVPTKWHGAGDALLIARAYGLGDLRSGPDLKVLLELLDLRNREAHGPAFVHDDAVRRAGFIVYGVLAKVASAWYEEFPLRSELSLLLLGAPLLEHLLDD